MAVYYINVIFMTEYHNNVLVLSFCLFFNKEQGGKLYPAFFSTSGNATLPRQCAEMGDRIVAQMVDVDRVLHGQEMLDFC